MVTADDVCRVAIFAGLDRADCELLARAAADISLQPREYAAHQGADRALFAVLEGKIEAVRLVAPGARLCWPCSSGQPRRRPVPS